MDKEILVDNQIEDGRRLVSQLVADDFPVVAAFWVTTADEGLCHLYIASPFGPSGRVRPAYGLVHASLSKIPDPEITLTEIKLIPPDDPIAQDVLETQRRHPRRIATRTRRPRLGGMAVDEVYIYPVPKPRRSAGHPFGTRKVRLKSAVDQKFRDDELLEPLTPREASVLGQIVSSGVVPAQAEYLVRMRRERERHRPPIPAGTVVEAWITGWWGDSPEDDPDPLLEVEAPDGTQGLTFKDNVEPI